MDFEALYKECGKNQTKNFYKNHSEEFKSLSMDLEDIEQEIRIKIWETYELLKKTKPEMGKVELFEYLTRTVQNELRHYVTKSMVSVDDVSLKDFEVYEGLTLTDEQILQSLYERMKKDYPENAELYYEIVYKKLFIGRTEPEIVEDLIAEGIVKDITRTRVMNIFWKKIVPKYRKKGYILRNNRLHEKRDDGTDNKPDQFELPDPIEQNEDTTSEPSVILEPIEASLFDNIKDLLTGRQYEIVEKVFKEQKTFQEIADELSVAKGTVKNQYDRALVKLREIMKK